ncbi:hypothetical protein [Glycomyces rhizosphaerae]|uniref:Secreted protein n=1 Tax=Glycomyces rhizosphaerae TaxID=2054422 RepID=A0ABV7PX57_9ACTN
MLELILAGVIIGAVMAAAVITSVRDRHRRKADRLSDERDVESWGEPIPGGWVATGGVQSGIGDAGGSGGSGR